MNPDQLLDKLAPLREPSPINEWAIASGWWVLLVLTMVLIFLIFRRLIAKQKASRYRKIAFREIEALRASENSLPALNRILKATALKVFPNETVAALTQDQWLDFLESTCPDLDRAGLAPITMIYGAQTEKTSEQTLAAARHWILHHQVKS